VITASKVESTGRIYNRLNTFVSYYISVSLTDLATVSHVLLWALMSRNCTAWYEITMAASTAAAAAASDAAKP